MAPRPTVHDLILHLPATVPLEGDGIDVLPPELAEYVRSDAAVRAQWGRLVEQARALGALERLPVPEDLQGRVVAALHAGHRQERVTRLFSGLSRRTAPSELGARVRHLAERPFARLSAPSVLDRLVEVEVEVDATDAALASAGGGGGGTGSAGLRRPRLRELRAPWAAAALLALGLAATAWWTWTPASGPGERVGSLATATPIELVRPGDTKRPSRALAGLMDSMSGGALGGL